MTELQRLPLVPFQPEAAKMFSCSVACAFENGILQLEYSIEGPLAEIFVPLETALPGFKMGLWQHTCCECFLRQDGAAGYTEWNFSLDCNWWHCAFEGYRAPAKQQSPEATPQNLQIILRENYLLLMAAIAVPAAPGLRIGPAIIIEHASGSRSHWAVAHAGAKPDFHSPQTCVPLP